MSSIFPQIEVLRNIPDIHRQYAVAALNLIIEKVNEEEELMVGEGPEGRCLTFDGSEFENESLELRYNNWTFVLTISEHSQERDASQFIYKIFEDTDLYELIPERIKEALIPGYNDEEDEEF